MALDKITLHGIEDNAVTSAKIGVDVIVADDIAANAITVAELQDGAVSTAKIADLGVTHAKLHNTMDLSGKTVTLPSLSDLSVTTGTANATIAGDLQVGGSSAVSSAGIASIIKSGNSLEWGHGNASGYRSTLGALSGGGQPFIAFSAEHGTNANTFRTRGLKGHAMGTFDNAGGMAFKAIQSANADNQTNFIETMKISNEGSVTIPNQPMVETYYTGTNQHGAYAAGSSRNMVVFKPGGVRFYTGNNMYDSGTGRYTAQHAGTYYASWSGSQYNNGVSDYFMIQIRKNGSTQKQSYFNKTNLGSWVHLSGFAYFQLAVGDYIDFNSNHDSAGGNKGGFDISNYTNFAVRMVG